MKSQPFKRQSTRPNSFQRLPEPVDAKDPASANVLSAARRTSAVIHSHGHAPTRTTRFVLPGGSHCDLASYFCQQDWRDGES